MNFYKIICTIFALCGYILSCAGQATSFHFAELNEKQKTILQLKEVDAIKNAPFIFEGRYIPGSTENILPDTSNMEIHNKKNPKYYYGTGYRQIIVKHVYKGTVSVGDTIELSIKFNGAYYWKYAGGMLDGRATGYLEPGNYRSSKIFYCKPSSKKSNALEFYEETPEYRSITGTFRFSSLHQTEFIHGVQRNYCIGEEFHLTKMLNANPNLFVPEKYTYLKKE